MKYRAILTDPGKPQERPVQILSNSWKDIEDWTDRKLAAAVADNASVGIYETIETKIKFVPKPKKEEPPK